MIRVTVGIQKHLYLGLDLPDSEELMFDSVEAADTWLAANSEGSFTIDLGPKYPWPKHWHGTIVYNGSRYLFFACINRPSLLQPGDSKIVKPFSMSLETKDILMNEFLGYRHRLKQQLRHAKALVARRESGQAIQDFDIRGELYGLACEIAPSARHDDLVTMRHWLSLRGNERIVDLAAGTGFFTKDFLSQTTGEVIAVDPSEMQLSVLNKVCAGRARLLAASPDNRQAMSVIPDASVDVVSSFGGLHHVDDQRTMFEEVARILKPGGQFTAADVCANTTLARHFDEFVAAKCLTGHTAQWLDEAKLRELASSLPLKLERVEVAPLTWKFSSLTEMALFFKGLHAYDLSEQEVIDDLQTALGFTTENDQIILNWPMVFFRFVRT